MARQIRPNKHQDQDDQQDQAETAGRVVTPARLWGQAGKAPIRSRIRMMSSMVPSVITFSSAHTAARLNNTARPGKFRRSSRGQAEQRKLAAAIQR